MSPEKAEAVVQDATATVRAFYERHGENHQALRALFGSTMGFMIGEGGPHYVLDVLELAIRKLRERHPEVNDE